MRQWRIVRLQTVVELPGFLRLGKAIMAGHERTVLVDFIAGNPEEGISLGGGYRTIYVFGGLKMPIFLVTVFAKNEKDDLSKSEQAELVVLSKAFLARYGESR